MSLHHSFKLVGSTSSPPTRTWRFPSSAHAPAAGPQFFTSRVSLSHTPPPRRTGDATHVVAPRIPATAVAGAADKGASSPAVGAVPSLSASSHAGDAVPLAWAASLFFQERTDARAWGGAAPWFTQHATPPPPLAQRKDLVWRGQYSYSGAQRTLVGAAAFEDLSALWCVHAAADETLIV